MKKYNLKRNQKTLERGSIVDFNKYGKKLYVVTDVLKIDGRKWHMSQLSDNTYWPQKKENIKKCRLVVREVGCNTKGY